MADTHPPRRPPSTAPARPANVIALSRYRAELGRGRRLRRADALMEAPDLGAAVRALPGDELYYVIHELGVRDAGDILAAATPEQVQVVLDFAIWQRDRIEPSSLAEWVEALAAAPIDRIGAWLEGLDSELVGLLLRRGARIYDLTQEAPPDESEGTFFPTPDGFFLLDVTGFRGRPGGADESEPEGERQSVGGTLVQQGGDNVGEQDGDRDPEEELTSARALIRLVDAFYRTDKDLARRMLVGARSELDSELEENAFHWRQGRMADLGFADYYDALEVYREVASPDAWEGFEPTPIGLAWQAPGSSKRGRSGQQATGPQSAADTALRVPTALAERLADTNSSVFARAAHQLAGTDLENLRAALVTLTNLVLAADRVTPGDDAAVTAVLERMAATLDVGLERVAGGDEARGAEALRRIPLVRLFRVGVTVLGKVKRLALTLRRQGPLGSEGYRLAEPDDAAVLEAVTHLRPLYLRLLDDPPSGGERPFQSLADVARATAAIERAAAAQVLLHALGVHASDLSPDSEALAASAADLAGIDLGLIARTMLVRLLLSPSQNPPIPLEALAPEDVQAFEALLERAPDGDMKLPATVKKKAKAILEALTPSALRGAASAVAERWIAGLAPLEPVVVRRAPPKPRRR